MAWTYNTFQNGFPGDPFTWEFKFQCHPSNVSLFACIDDTLLLYLFVCIVYIVLLCNLNEFFSISCSPGITRDTIARHNNPSNNNLVLAFSFHLIIILPVYSQPINKLGGSNMFTSFVFIFLHHMADIAPCY